MTRRFATIVLLAAALTTGAATRESVPGQATPAGDITVSAASSLTEAFEQIGDDFQERYDATSVTFNFGSSSTLEAQLEQGAPADVFASADTANMQKLAGAGGVRGRPVVFARNRLQIAVEPGNPKHIEDLADTLADDVQLVLCADEVPCGKYAAEAYAKAGLDVPEVPTGLTAKDTLSKVALGEADAAVVYLTDVEAADRDVRGIAIPDRHNVVARYPIAVVSATENVPTAKAFVRDVTSRRGQTTLRSFGFLAP